MVRIKTIPKKEIEIPKPSIIHSEKFRIGIASVISSTIVFYLSFYLSEFSETTAIRDVGIVF